jgi:hypothetical protein
MKSFIRLIFACGSIFFVGCGEWSCPEEKYGIGQCPGLNEVTELNVQTSYWEQLMDVDLEIREPEIPQVGRGASRCDALIRLAHRIAPTYKLSPSHLIALVKNESGCGGNVGPRREPGQIGIALRATGSAAARYWSSWGVTQIMGYRAKHEYGVEPEELLEDETALELGAAIYRKCYDQETGTEEQRSFRAAVCYNGGQNWRRLREKDGIYAYGLRFLKNMGA